MESIKGLIYKITDNNNTKTYYGSTTKTLQQRFRLHKNAYKRYNVNKHNKVSIFDIFNEFGCENCKIELVENVEVNDKKELREREGHYIRNNECINKNISGRDLIHNKININYNNHIIEI